jgi:hypothetical protein
MLSVQFAKAQRGTLTTRFFMRERRLPESLEETDGEARVEEAEEPLENMDEMRRLDRFFSTTDMARGARPAAVI